MPQSLDPIAAPRAASRTALAVAAARAAHLALDGEPKILVDPIAARLFEAGELEALRANMGPLPAGFREMLRAQVVLRSRYAEDRLAAAVARGVRQCVVLGAGFDTFAYRQPEWARRLRIYEVDHGASQAEKRLRLSRAGVAVPDNLDFVAIDFERVSLAEGLRASRIDFAQPAFFSCLGVLLYLTPEAVEAVFRLVASFPRSSEIAFTFSDQDLAGSELAEVLTALGEPILSHFEPATMPADLGAMGFADIEILDAEEANRRYFAGRDDGLQAPRRGGIAAAIVG